MSVSVYLSTGISLELCVHSAPIFFALVTYGCPGSIFIWQYCHTLCTCSFMDDSYICTHGSTLISWQWVTSLLRHAQDNATAALYWLCHVLDDGGYNGCHQSVQCTWPCSVCDLFMGLCVQWMLCRAVAVPDNQRSPADAERAGDGHWAGGQRHSGGVRQLRLPATQTHRQLHGHQQHTADGRLVHVLLHVCPLHMDCAARLSHSERLRQVHHTGRHVAGTW